MRFRLKLAVIAFSLALTAALAQAQVLSGYGSIAPSPRLAYLPAAADLGAEHKAYRPVEITTAAYQTAAQPAPLSPAPAVQYYSPAATVPVQVSAPVTVASAGQFVTDPCACQPAAPATYYPAQPAAPQIAYMPAPAGETLPPGYRFGAGLIGQPVVYVEGQPVRNFFRFLSP